MDYSHDNLRTVTVREITHQHVSVVHHWHKELTRTHTALHFWTYYDDLSVNFH